MHAAPPVSVDAHDGGLGRAIVAVLVGLSAGVSLRWAILWLSVPLEPLGRLPGIDIGAAAIGASLFGAWAWRHVGDDAVRLSWDGATWHWHAGGAPAVAGRARVVFDLGRWLLVAFDPDPDPDPRADTVAPGGWRVARQALRRMIRPGPRRRWRVLDDMTARPARAALYAAHHAAAPGAPDRA